MSPPIDLAQAVIDRLTAEVAALKGVEGALELADLLGRNILPPQFPHAFILSVGEDAESGNILTGLLSQRVVETIGVLIVDKRAGDRSGDRTRAGLEPLKTSVRVALAGWQPGAGYGPFEEARARLVGIAGGAGFMQIDFRTDWLIRAAI
jgi:hypothetical protein